MILLFSRNYFYQYRRIHVNHFSIGYRALDYHNSIVRNKKFSPKTVILLLDA